MAVSLKVNRREFDRWTQRKVVRGITAATVEAHRIARKKASIPNTGRQVKVKRAHAGGNKNTRTTYPNSSKPPESPRRRTGFGQKNIVMGVSGAIGRVGYTSLARYMTYHELGIRYARKGFQRRATIVPTIRDNLRRLGQVFNLAMKR